jgi:hypothetical protein
MRSDVLFGQYSYSVMTTGLSIQTKAERIKMEILKKAESLFKINANTDI